MRSSKRNRYLEKQSGQENDNESKLTDSANDVPYDPSVGAKMIENYEKAQKESSVIIEEKKDNNIFQDISFKEKLPVKKMTTEERDEIAESEITTQSIPEIIDSSIPENIQEPVEIKFNDFISENSQYQKEITSRLSEVFISGKYTSGNQTQEFEQRFAKFVGKKYCLTVKNNFDAIVILLKHILSERPDATIILPNYGSYSIAIAVKNCTDKIRFVDVDESLTMDVKKLPDLIKNGVIIASNLFGNNCNIKIIKRYALSNNHILIEDCSHSVGSVSSLMGDYGIFSFNPENPLGTMGSGGAICTDSNEAHKKLIALRCGGLNPETKQIEQSGILSFMNEIECAVLNAKLDKYEHLIEKRRTIASRYKKIVDGIRINSTNIYQQFVVLFNEREKIIEALKESNIPFKIPYEHHISDMPLFSYLKHEVKFKISDKIISLPCHAFMTEQEIVKVEEFLFKYKELEYIP